MRLLKRFLPQSLFGRSLIILITPLLVVQVILGYIFFDRHTETILRTLSQTIAGNIALLVFEYPRLSTKDLRTLARQTMDVEVAIHPNRQLDRVGQYRDGWLYKPLINALDTYVTNPYFVRMTPDDLIIQVQTPDSILQITMERKRFFSRTTPLVLIWTTLSACFLFVVASLFMRNQIRPIRRLADVADRFGQGEIVDSFKPEGALEVRKAGIAFIRMRDRLQRLLNERLEMLAGISHDLRTPLTRLKLALAMTVTDDRRLQMQADVTMLQHMIEGFLAFAKGVNNEQRQHIQLMPWLHEISRQHPDLTINITGNNSIRWPIKVLSINRCLTNIIVNSEKNATTLSIHVFEEADSVVIHCDDNGPGISEAEWENVFRPFYRLDRARNLDNVGVGLGLSITRDIILAHGGGIALDHSPLGGLRVTITLPRS